MPKEKEMPKDAQLPGEPTPPKKDPIRQEEIEAFKRILIKFRENPKLKNLWPSPTYDMTIESAAAKVADVTRPNTPHTLRIRTLFELFKQINNSGWMWPVEYAEDPERTLNPTVKTTITQVIFNELDNLPPTQDQGENNHLRRALAVFYLGTAAIHSLIKDDPTAIITEDKPVFPPGFITNTASAIIGSLDPQLVGSEEFNGAMNCITIAATEPDQLLTERTATITNAFRTFLRTF